MHSLNLPLATLGERAEGVLRVLSSKKIGTASWRYYTDSVACQATDYYLGVGEAPGRWTGQGLPELGLAAGERVTEQQLEALFARGLHPVTGKRLGRAWRKDAVTGYDLTFSAPKSVSALWALGTSEVAAAALTAHQEAVKAGLAYLEGHASWSRRGTNGIEQIATAGLTAALFEHRTSRAADPQLHTHALVVNKARCVDGVWRTLDGKEIFDHQKTAGMIYQNALRNEIQRRLGVEFGPVSKDGQADIVGVPTALLKLWSKRTEAIEAEAGPKIAEYEQLLGRSLTKAERIRVTKIAVLKTRPGKTHPEITTLQATWTAEAAGVGWGPDRLAKAAGVRLAGLDVPSQRQAPTLAHAPKTVLPTRSGQDPQTEVALAALLAAGRRSAVFSRNELAGQVAAHLPNSGLTAAQVVARVEQLTDHALTLSETVPVGRPPRGLTPRASDPRYATVEVLQAESRILNLARRGRQRGYGYGDPNHLRDTLIATATASATSAGAGAGTAPGRLDGGQLRAVQHLTAGGDFLSVLTAPAGAGKTSTLGTASRTWQAAGYRVVGLAPSARAAAELADATGDRADTLAKWLHNTDRLDRLPAAERAWTALDDRTILIVDEASMASTLDLDRLTALAGKAAAKVVLVGDPGQIGVINGPGGMLAALAHAGHAIELEQIHRFSNDWERTASLQLRAGNPQILLQYLEQGRLHPCPESDTALEGVFDHWSQARADGQDALMLARTRLDVEALNRLARAAAQAAGDVTGPVTTAGDRDWQAGDALRTRRNDRTLTFGGAIGSAHVRNGDRYRVLGPGPGPDGGLVVEDLTGRGRLTLPVDYLEQHCEYGWASTIDSAQGATADVGIVLVRPGLDREHLYVAMTRGRHGNHAYITTDPATDPEHDHGHGQGSRHAHGQESARRGQGSTRASGQESLPFGQDVAAVGQDTGEGRRAVEARRRAENDAGGVLVQALRQSGAQDSAHTALAAARQAAADQARKDSEQAAREAQRQRNTPTPMPPEHQQAIDVLEQLQDQRQALLDRQGQLRTALRDTERDLAAASRWARARRRDLVTALADGTEQLHYTLPGLGQFEELIRAASTVVDTHTRHRRIAEQAQQRPTLAAVMAGLRSDRDLADPRPADATAAPTRADVARAAQPRLPGLDQEPYRPPATRDSGGLSR